MLFDDPSRHKGDPFDSANSTQGKSAVRYALSVVVVVYLAIGGLLTALAIENASTFLLEVHLTFFGRWTLTVPVGVLLLCSCALGALLLYVVTVLSAWRERRELVRLRTRVAALERAQKADIVDGNAGAQPSSPSFLIPMPGVGSPEPPSVRKWHS